MTLQTIRQHRCFGGIQGIHRHASVATGSVMEFAVFVPPQAAEEPVPVLTWLPGLACTWETFTAKAGAQRCAAELGLMLVTPDTSPRGLGLPGETESPEMGAGAGFYVDATVAPWSRHYRMFSYVTAELPALIARHFPADLARQGIFGHEMGGHGALVCALRHPEQYRSVSAFAPICAPCRCPWGERAFTTYLGPDRAAWASYDACALMGGSSWRRPILVDQGTADEPLDEQLKPHLLEEACGLAGVPLTLRLRENYDHSHYFIATFIADHLAHHAARLRE